MATCNSCGGVIGRDCFNPRECMEITQDQAMRYEQQGDVQGEIASLHSQVSTLTRQLADAEARGMERAAEIVAGWDVGHDSASRSIVLTLRAEAKKIREGKV